MGTAGRYLLVFGANMALRERAVVAALRVFDGPIATISPAARTRSGKFFDYILRGDSSDVDSALEAVTDFEKQTGLVPAGVVPFIDAGLMPGWAIANHFGLPYLPHDAARDSSINKQLMKERLVAAGVPTPRHVQVGSVDDVLAAAHEFGLPCVIKPSAFGGSLGVRLITRLEEAAQAYAYVAKIIADNAATFTVTNRAIQVEEYCDLADEVSLEILSHHSQRTVLAVVDKSLGPRPFFAEMGHRVPSRYSAREDIRELALCACAAIGLDHGLAHVEVRCEGARQPQVIEVGARTAGGGIIDQLERGLGIAPYELHVRSYLERLDSPPEPQPAGVAAIAMLKAPPGRIVEIRAPARVPAAVVSYEIFAAAGNISERPANYLNREGYVECFWPGPGTVPPAAHLDIAEELAAQIFRVEQDQAGQYS